MKKWPISKYLIACLTCMAGLSFIYSNLAFSKDPDQAATNMPKAVRDSFIFMCDDFSEKIQNCEPYSCEVSLMGTTTVTQIQGKKEDRCVVATIVGYSLSAKKDQQAANAATPVSTTCEYDQDGIEELTNKFEAMKHGKFDFSSKQIQKGEFNCKTSALGQTFPTPKGPIPH